MAMDVDLPAYFDGVRHDLLAGASRQVITAKTLRARVTRLGKRADVPLAVDVVRGRPRLVLRLDGQDHALSPRLPMSRMLWWLEAFKTGMSFNGHRLVWTGGRKRRRNGRGE